MTVVDGVRLVSNSEVQSFKWCRRNWWLSWYRGLTLPYENYVSAAATGGRIHEALAVMYVPDGVAPGDPLETLLAVQHRDVQAQALKRLEAYGDDEVKVLDEVDEKLRQQFDLEQAMIEGYVNWISETGADSDWEVVGAEIYAEAPLEVPRSVFEVKLIGKLDASVRSRVNGVRRFIDHKTVGSLQDPLLGLNQQMLHYHLIQWLSTPEGEKRCEGALYNMLRKVKRSRASKPPYYARHTINHNRHELETYRAKVTGVITDIINVEHWLEQEVSEQQLVYPTPSRDCTWKCQFLKVCRMFDDGSRVEAALEELYVQRDPLHYYGGREKSGAED